MYNLSKKMAGVKVLSLILVVFFPWSYSLPSATEANILGNNLTNVQNILKSNPSQELYNHITMNAEAVQKLLEIVSDTILHNDVNEKNRINEEKAMNSTEQIVKFDLNYVLFKVTTKDGYIISLIRVFKDKVGDGKVVALIPGMGLSSDDFLTLGKDKSIVTKLVNNGYDVWLCNFRGNAYSRTHTYLDPNDKDFWDFSFDEMGTIDAPALINFILEHTGKDKLTVISQSQSATFVMLSEVHEMNDKLELHISMGTFVFMSNLRSRIVQLCGIIWKILEKLFNLLNIYEFLPRGDLKKSSSICGSSPIASWLCLTVVFHIFGFDYPQIDKNVQVQLTHAPAGSSIKELLHYLQLVQSGEYRKYDHGASKNMMVYNSTTPPSYKLKDITVKTVLIHGRNDMLCSNIDIEKLCNTCPNITDVIVVDHPEFQHQDFVWAKNAPELVYETIIKLIN